MNADRLILVGLVCLLVGGIVSLSILWIKKCKSDVILAFVSLWQLDTDLRGVLFETWRVQGALGAAQKLAEEKFPSWIKSFLEQASQGGDTAFLISQTKYNFQNSLHQMRYRMAQSCFQTLMLGIGILLGLDLLLSFDPAIQLGFIVRYGMIGIAVSLLFEYYKVKTVFKNTELKFLRDVEYLQNSWMTSIPDVSHSDPQSGVGKLT